MATLRDFLRNPKSTLTSVDAGNPPLHLPVETIFGTAKPPIVAPVRQNVTIDHSTPFELIYNRPANTITQV
jgi:hypothetical protein